MSETLYDTTQALDIALADTVMNTLWEGVAERGTATLVVSGGSTPKGLFNLLSARPGPWDAITITLADERWVPLDHKDSNEAMVRRELLRDQAATATFVSLTPTYPNVDKNIVRVCEQLDKLPHYDLVLLGMGGDMHTASLFPCSPELGEGMSTQAPALMTRPTSAPHARVSQSLTRLLATRRGIVHLVGEGKLEVLASAQAVSDPMAAPISAFIQPAGPFEIWASR